MVTLIIGKSAAKMHMEGVCAVGKVEAQAEHKYIHLYRTTLGIIWDSLNGTLDKIGHGTRDNVY